MKPNNYEEELAKWKAKHGLTCANNTNEMAMVAEDQLSKQTSWCSGCDVKLPVKQMKIVTRRVDPYRQTFEGEGEYIPNSERVRMCEKCFAENYEAAGD